MRVKKRIIGRSFHNSDITIEEWWVLSNLSITNNTDVDQSFRLIRGDFK